MSTIRDVAKIAGVAISTVSLALNQPERVSKKTFRKVMDAAEQAGYSANPIAKSLKLGRSPIISMIVADIRTSFWQGFVQGMEAEAYRNSFLVSLSNTTGVPTNVELVLDHVIAQRVAGIILSAPRVTGPILNALERTDIPVLLVDHKLEGVQGDFIALDNRLAVGMLTRHLVSRGHKSIGFVSGQFGHWSATERLDAFVASMASNGLSADQDLILDGEWKREGGYNAAMRLLVGDRRPSAIIVANDEMMIGVLQACQELGFAHGEEISLCSVDSMPWGDVLRPRITHVVQPVDQMAAQAAIWLYERVHNRANDIPMREHLFAPQLVLGDSVADVT